MPSDRDSICPVGTSYSTNFETSGLQVGDTAYDFTLYDINGNRVSLAAVLGLGKPVLLVAGSYTCPIFRANIPIINAVDSAFHGQITTLIVYTPEAHPIIDLCPYGPYFVDVIQQNQDDHIQYRQPRTYGDRKKIVRDMLTSIRINVPVLVDATCNQWFLTYGPAPNNGYLIDTRGIVRAKEPWFDLNGENIFDDVADLLGSDTLETPIDTGAITFQFLTNDTVYTTPGSTVALGGKLVNNSSSAAEISVYRHNSSKLPVDWKTAMCTDVCFGPDEDSAFIDVPAYASKQIIVYFYVGTTPGVGRVSLHFANENISSDTSRVRFVVIASDESGVKEQEASVKNELWCVPNPVSDLVLLHTNASYDRIRIIDVLGHIILESPASDRYDLRGIPSGSYQIELLSKERLVLGMTSLIKQ
jgi:hypothetical protein